MGTDCVLSLEERIRLRLDFMGAFEQVRPLRMRDLMLRVVAAQIVEEVDKEAAACCG